MARAVYYEDEPDRSANVITLKPVRRSRSAKPRKPPKPPRVRIEVVVKVQQPKERAVSRRIKKALQPKKHVMRLPNPWDL